jgi:integrase
MPVVLISEALLSRSTISDGRLLRDRVLSGFCVRMNPRKRTFRVATSVAGKQFRMNLGYWPTMSVEEARTRAMVVLAQCRQGVRPAQPAPTPALPTLRATIASYCAAKGIKASSQSRYDSLLRTHFPEWLDRSVVDLAQPAFTEHCQAFAQARGAALVELARGLVGAVIKYVNAMHGCDLVSPFSRLATIGLLPDRATPRARVLQERDLPTWKCAVDQLGERQRDLLMLVFWTGLRRNEARHLRRAQIDLDGAVLRVVETKNGKPHTLPITPVLHELLERRCAGLGPDDELFQGVAADHLAKMAARAGAPAFMLHDLRKIVATVGERLGVGDAVLRRILNHAPPRGDVLHRHYVSKSVEDIREPLERVQAALMSMIKNAQ